MPVYYGTQNTNCIIYIPQDVNLELDPLNVTVTGSPTISSGVVSGFSSANYLTIPKVLPSKITSSEYVFKITTGASVTSPENQIISAHKSPNTGNIIIRGSKFHLFTGSWNAGVTTVLPNTTYILKTVFNGSNWTLYSSTNNTNWVQEATWNTTNSYAGTNLYIGRDYDTTSEYFGGSIDLSQSYIKVNGSTWWQGGTGKVTLKKNCKVYVPNGSGVFDEVITSKDLSNFALYAKQACVITNGSNLYWASSVASGSTEPTSPTTGSIWYDTTNNVVKRYSGSSWVGGFALPVGILNPNTTEAYVIISEVQTFNGFGYIGSTVFALPNVKGLIPNGFNEDGTYKSIEFTARSVTTKSSSGTWNGVLTVNPNGSVDMFGALNYNQETNYNYNSSGIQNFLNGGSFIFVDGKITSLTPNPVQPKQIAREGNLYLGTQNTNCITYIPEDVKVRLDPIAWTQPTLTANGTMGGDSFACTQQTYYTETSGAKQEAWRMFAEGNAHEWQINNVSTSSTYWAKFYNPEVIKISKFQVVNPATGVSNHSPAKVVLYGSNDDSTYTEMGVLTDITTTASAVFDLYLTHSDWYKYYKIEVTPRNTTAVAVGRLKITAKSDDYVVVEKGGLVYVPNGYNTTNRVTLTKELKGTSKSINSTHNCLMFLNSAGNSLDFSIVTKCYTSDTNPAVTYSAWWDTTNNKIYRFAADSTTPKQQLSLPIALVKFNDQQRITGIKPFKGVSFFGKRLIGLPGVKGLIPNGYGDNQTFNNIEFEWKWNTVYQVGYVNKTIGIRAFETYIASGYTYYDLNTNKLYADNTLANHRVCAQIGTYTTNSDGNIIDVDLYPVQPEYTARKIDFVYNGSTLIKHNFKPITFHTYPEPQPWTVPLGVTKIHVDCVASSGCDQNSNLGGKGGRVQCDLTVTPGETLYFTVGYIPSICYTAEYNASDIRRGGTEYANRVVVAGGGGSASNHKAGGNGGGLTGADGEDYNATNVTGGGGGTQTAGGAGGVGNRINAHGHDHQGEAGTLGMGGNAGTDNYEGPRGAGGAGYYGGGSGAASWSDSYKGTAGGGGGSSYTNSSVCSNVTHTQGYRKGAGYITISLA